MAHWELLRKKEINSPIDCGVPECDRETAIMSRPWPDRGCCIMGRKKGMLS